MQLASHARVLNKMPVKYQEHNIAQVIIYNLDIVLFCSTECSKSPPWHVMTGVSEIKM